MMEHKIILLVRVNVFNSTHPTKRNFSIIICFMLFAEWLQKSIIMLMLCHQAYSSPPSVYPYHHKKKKLFSFFFSVKFVGMK